MNDISFVLIFVRFKQRVADYSLKLDINIIHLILKQKESL